MSNKTARIYKGVNLSAVDALLLLFQAREWEFIMSWFPTSSNEEFRKKQLSYLTPVVNYTLLHEAIVQPAPIHIVQYLLNNGLDVNAKERFGMTALHMCMCQQSATDKFAELLLRHGANPNIENYRGTLPLARATRHKLHPAIIPLLLKYGADVNGMTHLGTALHAAVHENAISVMEILLEYDADPNCKARESGLTPLQLGASERCSLKTATVLIEFGADATLETDDGLTALDIAMAMGGTHLIPLLTSPPPRTRHPRRLDKLIAAPSCGNCSKVATAEKRLFQCKGCFMIRYCDMACAKAHWHVHKQDCRRAAAAAAAATGQPPSA